MNRKNIQKVRDVIAALPRAKFDMSALYVKDGSDAYEYDKTPKDIVHNCGTAACIAGWTLAVLKPRTKGLDSTDAARLFGLDDDDGDSLFMPPGFADGSYTRAHAVRVLDHLLETGEVDWKSTRRAKKAPKPSAQDTSHASDKGPGRTR